MRYFGYGSNLNLAEMEHRCPGSKLIKPVMLEGYRLEFIRGILTIIRTGDESDIVPGAIFEINSDHETRLDSYEGYPRLYIKKYVVIDGEEVMFYQLKENEVTDTDTPGNSYHTRVKRGYEELDLPVEVLGQAYRRAMCRRGEIA